MRTLRHTIGMLIGLPTFEWMVRMGTLLLFRTDPELVLRKADQQIFEKS